MTETPLSDLQNYQPRNSSSQSSPARIAPSTAEYPVMAFTSVNAPLVKGQPYCIQFMPMNPPDSANYVSLNGATFWSDSTGLPIAENFFPDFLDLPNGSPQCPYPTWAFQGAQDWRYCGDLLGNLRYEDGTWFGCPAIAQDTWTNGGTYPTTINKYARIAGSLEARDRRRVTLANRIVDGVWVRIVRFPGTTTGDLVFRLEDAGTEHGVDTDDFAGNGTLLKQVTAPPSSFLLLPRDDQTHEYPEHPNTGVWEPPYQQVHRVFMPFGEQITLQVGLDLQRPVRKSPQGTANMGGKPPEYRTRQPGVVPGHP
jgi:hypothetical protein